MMDILQNPITETCIAWCAVQHFEYRFEWMIFIVLAFVAHTCYYVLPRIQHLFEDTVYTEKMGKMMLLFVYLMLLGTLLWLIAYKRSLL